MYARPLGNIISVEAIDLIANGDYEPFETKGFFIRAEVAGYITYWPLHNDDADPITKWFEISYIFIDPELCRKIAAVPLIQTSPDSAADGIYVGYGF